MQPHRLLVPCMHVVFQSISSSAMVPEQWHTTLLMPIYKGKGQLSDPSNYRPLQACPYPMLHVVYGEAF
jgi:hypothetical protein